MKELIIASSNVGKIKELSALLAPIQCIAQTTLGVSDAEESGLSFIENALIKARHSSLMTQKPALADDSGLVVPALNGEPGIYSARFAGVPSNDINNIHYLLDKMKDIPLNQRQAYFYCAIVLVQHAKDPTPIIATGVFHGRIATELSGQGGFGYDPIFYIDDYQCTAAQLPSETKNKISHRAQALKQLRALIL